jgi:phosphoribosyl 1,2-cyclic phosphodiesterase
MYVCMHVYIYVCMYVCIGVVSVYMYYNCVYYCDTCYIPVEVLDLLVRHAVCVKENKRGGARVQGYKGLQVVSVGQERVGTGKMVTFHIIHTHLLCEV